MDAIAAWKSLLDPAPLSLCVPGLPDPPWSAPRPGWNGCLAGTEKGAAAARLLLDARRDDRPLSHGAPLVFAVDAAIPGVLPQPGLDPPHRTGVPELPGTRSGGAGNHLPGLGPLGGVPSLLHAIDLGRDSCASRGSLDPVPSATLLRAGGDSDFVCRLHPFFELLTLSCTGGWRPARAQRGRRHLEPGGCVAARFSTAFVPLDHQEKSDLA